MPALTSSTSSRLRALRPSPTLAVLAFFGALLGVGLAVHADFGVTSDEVGLRHYGKLMYAFLSEGDTGYESFSNLRYYGPVVPILLEVAERVVPTPPERTYALRHLVNFLVYLVGVAAFFGLATRQFRSWRWGLFATAVLVATPRLFAHAFVNVKDVPFLSFFVLNIYLLVSYLETRRPALLVALGAATALLIDVRILGVLVPALAVAALVADELASARPRFLARVAGPLAVYLAVAAPLTVLLWPYLWADPAGRFVETFQVFNRFRAGPRYTLYMGEMVRTKLVPWHFLPVWIGISTPIPYLLLFLAGLGWFAARLGRAGRLFQERSPDRFFLLHAAWLFAPLLWIMVRSSIVYDDWRQVLFVYPALVLFAVAGARFLAARLSAWRPLGVSGGRLFQGALAVVVGSVLLTMVRLHPYNAVFFNRLVGGPEGAENRFEMDYWGFSYKEGFEHLLSAYPGNLRIRACFGPGPDNAVLFRDRERLRFVSLAEADFVMCARWESPHPFLPGYKTVYRVSREGAGLLYIKRLRINGRPVRAGPGVRQQAAPKESEVDPPSGPE